MNIKPFLLILIISWLLVWARAQSRKMAVVGGRAHAELPTRGWQLGMRMLAKLENM